MIPIRPTKFGRYGIITISSLLVSLVAVAGSLTPPGAPASTMRTLQEIYNTVVGPFDSSLISSDQDGSVIQGLKYISNNLSWASSSNNIYNTNSGNVGIGTTDPQYTLDVLQAAGGAVARFNTHAFISELDGSINVSGGGYLDSGGSWHSTGLGGYAAVSVNDPYFGGFGTIALLGSSSDVDDSQITFATFFPDGSFSVGGDYEASDATIYGLSDGNVGIGTDSPAKLFQVDGDVQFGGTGYGSLFPGFGRLFLRTDDGAGFQPFLLFQDLTYGNAMGLSFITDGTTAGTRIDTIDNAGDPIYTLTESGNVGIGTTGPMMKLDIVGNDNTDAGVVANVTNTNAGNLAWGGYQVSNDIGAIGWMFAGSSTYIEPEEFWASRLGIQSSDLNSPGITIMATRPDADIRIYTGGYDERMRITNSGNVGIGTTEPETEFEVVGTASASALTGAGLTDCDLESQTLNWDATTGRFSCLTDGTGSGTAVGLREGFTGSFTNFSSISFNAAHFVLDTGNPDARLSLDWGVGGPASLSQNETVMGSWTFASNTTFSAGASMAGNFDPAVDNTYSLGDLNYRWKDINVGPGSFNITSTTGIGGAGTNYTLGQIGFTGSSLSFGTFDQGTGSYGSLELKTASTSRMFIASGGNVGIGTTNPNLYKVQIATSGTSNQSALAAYDADSIIFDVFTSSTDGVARVINGSATPRVQLHSNGNSYFTGGNVGIGTTNPAAKFQVIGTTGSISYAGPAPSGFTADSRSYIEYGSNVFTSLNDSAVRASGLMGGIQDDTVIRNIIGTYGWAESTNSVLSTKSVVALNGDAYNSGSGGVASVRGLVTYAAQFGSGPVGELTGAYLGSHDVGVGAGTVTNNFGLYIGNQADVGINNYALYSEVGPFVVEASGSVGIGTANPSSHFSVVASASSTDSVIARFTNRRITDDTSTTVFSLRVGTAVTGTNARFIQFYANASTSDSLGTGVGRIRLNNGNVAYETGGADFAEYFNKGSSSFEEGDLVTIKEGQLVQLASSGSGNIVGIVSARSGFIGGTPPEGTENTKVIVGLMGRVPLKVSLENGSIQAGDRLTASSIPGVAMKATEAGQVVGIALESIDTISSESYNKVLTFVNVSYWAPDVESISSDADSDSGDQTSAASVLSYILGYLKNAVLQVKGLVADTIRAKNFEIEDSDGSGKIYCVRIVSGEWDKQEGECSSTPETSSSSSDAAEPQEPETTEEVTTEEPTPEEVTASDPEPVPDPVPDPAPDPEPGQ